MERKMNIELAEAFCSLFAVFSLLPWFPSSLENKQPWLLCTWDYENIKSISIWQSALSFPSDVIIEREGAETAKMHRTRVNDLLACMCGLFYGGLLQSPSRLHSYCFSWNTASMWLLLFDLMSPGQPSEAAKWQAGVGRARRQKANRANASTGPPAHSHSSCSLNRPPLPSSCCLLWFLLHMQVKRIVSYFPFFGRPDKSRTWTEWRSVEEDQLLKED